MILGINPLADVSAALFDNNKLISYNERERFEPRWKHSRRYNPAEDRVETLTPREAVLACLRDANASFDDIKVVAIPWSIDVHYHEMLRNVPFEKNEKMIAWEKASVERYSEESLKQQILSDIPELEHAEFEFITHHYAHAATGMLSKFDHALVIVADGHGDKYAISAWEMYPDGFLKKLFAYPFYNSLGWFYSGITEFLGMNMKNDETKVMNLANYAKLSDVLYKKLSNIVQIKDNDVFVDSSYLLYGPHKKSKNPRFSDKMIKLLGEPYENLQKNFRYRGDVRGSYPAKIALAAQKLLEDAMEVIVRKALEKLVHRCEYLVLAGGVFLNCRLNTYIGKKFKFKDVFILPPAHDGGTAVGAAAIASRLEHKNKRPKPLQSPFMGVSYTNKQVEETLEKSGLNFVECDPDTMIYELLARNEVVAVFRGRREMGPRALLNTSILCLPYPEQNYLRINTHKKSVLWRDRSPSMTYETARGLLIAERFWQADEYMLTLRECSTRHLIPAVMSERHTVRPQITDDFAFLSMIEDDFGLGCVLNTSLNQSGLAMAGTPEHAINDCKEMGIRHLIINDFYVEVR